MDKRYIFCHECNRGGNGNDKDKCACGWQVKSKRNKAGCYIGEPIKPAAPGAKE
jgi:hypothetical protein